MTEAEAGRPACRPCLFVLRSRPRREGGGISRGAGAAAGASPARPCTAECEAFQGVRQGVPACLLLQHVTQQPQLGHLPTETLWSRAAPSGAAGQMAARGPWPSTGLKADHLCTRRPHADSTPGTSHGSHAGGMWSSPAEVPLGGGTRCSETGPRPGESHMRELNQRPSRTRHGGATGGRRTSPTGHVGISPSSSGGDGHPLQGSRPCNVATKAPLTLHGKEERS